VWINRFEGLLLVNTGHLQFSHCERSEAISLARGPFPGDCRVASLLAKTHESVLHRLVIAQRGDVLAMTK